MAEIGYIESLLGAVADPNTKLAIRRVAEELLRRIAEGGGGDSSSAVPAGDTAHADIADADALSVFGRAGNTPGPMAPIVAATDGHVLKRVGSALAFAAVGGGDVVGPAGGVVDNEIATYSGATGKIIKGSGVTASGGSVTAPNFLTAHQSYVNGAFPTRQWTCTTDPVNAKIFRADGWGQQLGFHACNDAGTAVATPLRLYRDGNVQIGGQIAVKGAGAEWTEVAFNAADYVNMTTVTQYSMAYYLYNNIMTFMVFWHATYGGATSLAIKIPAGKIPTKYSAAPVNIQCGANAVVSRLQMTAGDNYARIHPAAVASYTGSGFGELFISFPF